MGFEAESTESVIDDSFGDDDSFSNDPFFNGDDDESDESYSQQEEKSDLSSYVNADDEEEKCHGKGVFQVAPCAFGAPLVLSWPHFLDTDHDLSFLRHLEGVSADRDLHEMSMSVQPDMGIALAGNVRLQINVQIEKIAGRNFSGKADRKFITYSLYYAYLIKTYKVSLLSRIIRLHFESRFELLFELTNRSR